MRGSSSVSRVDCEIMTDVAVVEQSTSPWRIAHGAEVKQTALGRRAEPHFILQQDSIQRPYVLNCSILAASPCKRRRPREAGAQVLERRAGKGGLLRSSNHQCGAINQTIKPRCAGPDGRRAWTWCD